MALVLSRRSGDEIRLFLDPDYTQADLDEMVERGIVVTITAIEGNSTRIGIDAPDSVTILRSELLDD